jgi:peptidoglycan-associated lipoprotein
MRKILVALLIISLVVLVGCGKKQPVEDSGADVTVFPEEVTIEDTVEVATEDDYQVEEVTDSSADLGDEQIGERPITEMTVSEINAAEFLVTVYFDFDKSDLTDETARQLEVNGRWLAANPSVRVIVEGHCDERGTEEYNLALGEKRARQVQLFMARMGIEVGRLQTASYGESRPANRGSNEMAWAQNRRVHFRVFSK